jgi:hypothetical protein
VSDPADAIFARQRAINVVRAVLRFRLARSSESAFHADVERALATLGCEVKHEFDLGGGHGRVDFFIPDGSIAIELKVQGSSAHVARQVFRYAESPSVAAVVLVTTNAQHTKLPSVIAGKPLEVAFVSRGWL